MTAETVEAVGVKGVAITGEEEEKHRAGGEARVADPFLIFYR